MNNYKLAGDVTGSRTDVFYSFFGTSIRKPAPALKADGVQLCMCKLPNSQPIDSEWHRERKKWAGIDYRYIYQNRAAWWFCDTYVPTDDEFLEKFNFLGQHQPTTGFAAILDILSFDCRSVYITGFDFFESRLHNVDEPWKEGAHDDPIRHRPDLERLHVLQFARINPEKITLDDALRETL